jgi:hypothetical protein
MSRAGNLYLLRVHDVCVLGGMCYMYVMLTCLYIYVCVCVYVSVSNMCLIICFYSISVCVRMIHECISMSGWVQRASTTFLHGGEFKRRWMILVNQKLLCFEDPYTLNVSKGVIDIDQIYHISLNKKDNSLVIQLGHDGKSCWTIRWDESESQVLQDMWHRKFKRCVKGGIIFPDLVKLNRKSTL